MNTGMLCGLGFRPLAVILRPETNYAYYLLAKS